jgi:hypothetical protein
MEKANDILTMGSATHAAKRTADIVFILRNESHLDNSALTEQLNETLKSYGESDPKITRADLDTLKVVAQKIYPIFLERDTTATANLLNELLAEYARQPRLSMHSDTPWHIHGDSNDHAPWAEWFAASSALGLAILFAEKQRNPGGICASPSCGRPFIDLGKGGGRSYCSPKCATRERVAQYRKKHLSN